MKFIRMICSASNMLREGQRQAFLRHESQDIPANVLAIPDAVYIVMTDRGKGAAVDPAKRYTASIKTPMGWAVILEARTRREVKEQVEFGVRYGRYFASNAYRAYRVMFGFAYSAYRTAEQQAAADAEVAAAFKTFRS